jgi:hypothetical protein
MHGNWHHKLHGACVPAIGNWLLAPTTNNEISVTLKTSMAFCRKDNYHTFYLAIQLLTTLIAFSVDKPVDDVISTK